MRNRVALEARNLEVVYHGVVQVLKGVDSNRTGKIVALLGATALAKRPHCER